MPRILLTPAERKQRAREYQKRYAATLKGKGTRERSRDKYEQTLNGIAARHRSTQTQNERKQVLRQRFWESAMGRDTRITLDRLKTEYHTERQRITESAFQLFRKIEKIQEDDDAPN